MFVNKYVIKSFNIIKFTFSTYLVQKIYTFNRCEFVIITVYNLLFIFGLFIFSNKFINVY